MADVIGDNMATILPLEDCQMAMDGFQALESQSSLQVPSLYDAYVIGLLESLLDNDEVEVPQDHSYVAELEGANLLEDDGVEVPKADAYALWSWRRLYSRTMNEAWVIFE
jgi:hypothetical protein